MDRHLGDPIEMATIIIENREVSALHYLDKEAIEANEGIALPGGWIAEAVE